MTYAASGWLLIIVGMLIVVVGCVYISAGSVHSIIHAVKPSLTETKTMREFVC